MTRAESRVEPVSSNTPNAMAMGAMTGLCGSVMGSLNMSRVQLAIPTEIRGRIMAIMMMTHGLMPLGVLPISAAAEFIGIDVALLLSAGLLALSMLLLGLFVPELRTIDKGHGSSDSPEGDDATREHAGS